MYNSNNEMEFLDENNVAGRQLLEISARGSSIITELLRLSAHIPDPFFIGLPGSAHEVQERKRYRSILYDFKYLSNAAQLDEHIDNNADLLDLDEEFRENHFQLLERFYNLFESIYRYISDIQNYLGEMEQGNIVHYTIEKVLLDFEGCQLMVESIYMYGVMLLLLDMRVPGPVRERMIIAYYRYKSNDADNIQEIVRLCRATGFVPGGRRPPKYPESFFQRFQVPSAVIDMVINCLRTKDIYNHQMAYGTSSELRTMGLASQSSMLYVILFMMPQILHQKKAIMREICDRHFADNWVIPFYMGFTIDLSVMWEPYPAAKQALANVLNRQNIQEVLQHHVTKLGMCLEGLDRYLTEGVLVDEYVLDNISPLLAHVRNCNHTLRWFLLHRTTNNRKLAEQIIKPVPKGKLVALMNNTAQFEMLLKSMVSTLLTEKAQRWEESKNECVTRMRELAEYFSGQKALARVERNERLLGWFQFLGDEINALDLSQHFVSGRKIARIMNELVNVEEYEQIYSSLQIKQFLDDTRTHLKKMIRTVNVNAKVQSDLDIISEFSYAWIVIRDYTPFLHRCIESDQKVVLVLKSTFKKLASILDKPLVRISQAESKDDISVAEFHSSELVKYVRDVLGIVPISVFRVLDSIIQLLTHDLKPIPTKVERQYMRDLSQLDLRYQLTRATHQVSVFTEGVLAMKRTLVGIISLDPKDVLEAGIRKELVRQIAQNLNSHLIFNSGAVSDFEARLSHLGQKLDGFRQSFEYIQDYVNIYGLKIWQEEFSRIINYNVEQECNTFLKQKVYDWQSTYQSDAIPIPRFESVNQPNKEPSVNFMGRLVRELLFQTSPVRTVYVESMQGWYDAKMSEAVGIRTFSLLARAVGVFGLTGVDRLLSFMIVRDLTAFVRVFKKSLSAKAQNFIGNLRNHLHPTSQFPNQPRKLYTEALKRLNGICPHFLVFVVFIGQAQLLKRQIANELNFSARLDSKMLSCALETLNASLLSDVRNHYSMPDEKPYPGNPILPDITEFLDTSGVSNPISKIYITTEEAMDGIAVLLFVLTVNICQKLNWSPTLSTLTCEDKKAVLDGAPFVAGIATVTNQSDSIMQILLAFMS
jgi:WASH complex subunit strumpellin